eukprot:gene11691-11835_t
MLARSRRSAGTEISSSVIITGFYDFVPRRNGLSSCEIAVQNSKGYNMRKINFVVTLFAAGELDKLYRYYYKDEYGNSIPADAGSIDRFKQGLRKCFKAGLDAGFTTLHILPHVDPREHDINSGKGLWRNVVKFDPVKKYGPDQWNAFSYEDVLLRPTAEALNMVTKYNTTVEFTLSAEQGRSVWYYPIAYVQLLQRTKAVAARGKDARQHSFGVSFNYDKVCGCVEPEEKDPIKYNNTYLQRFDRFKAAGGLSKINVAGVKDLFARLDFIGVSAYAPWPQQLSPSAMEVPVQTIAFEMKPFGIDLNTYLKKQNKQLIYSEQGLGGCTEGARVAPDLAFVKKHPFWGAWLAGGYQPAKDPWRYRIDGIFMWSVGTWDVLGVAPGTTANGGSYADPVIADYIRQGNAIANQLQLPRAPSVTGRWPQGGLNQTTSAKVVAQERAVKRVMQVPGRTGV